MVSLIYITPQSVVIGDLLVFSNIQYRETPRTVFILLYVIHIWLYVFKN